MEKIHYSVTISAPREKVWKIMFADETYRQWTKPFNEGSYYIGNWEQGSEIRFVGSDDQGNAQAGGMYSTIAENRLYEFMSIKHLGIITNGVVDTTSDEVKKWAPAFENYTFTDVDGVTQLDVDMDIDQDYKESFDAMWPKALAVLKKLAEK
jgi:hypothetical protein